MACLGVRRQLPQALVRVQPQEVPLQARLPPAQSVPQERE
jgi:hypothetical protein